eukprot:Opistho-2@86571
MANARLVFVFVALAAIASASTAMSIGYAAMDESELVGAGFTLVESKFPAQKIYKKESHTIVFQGEHKPAKGIPDLMERFGITPEDYKNNKLRGTPTPDIKGNDYRFIPEYKGSIMPGANAAKWSGDCFKSNKASLVVSGNTATFSVELDTPSSLLCTEIYLIGSLESWHLHEFVINGAHTLVWKNLSDAALTDINENGFRVFKFVDGATDTLKEIFETLTMFVGGLGLGDKAKVPEEMETHNVKFLRDYVNYDMPARTIKKVVLNESEIHSGDPLVIIRLDGLDTMLAWGMGAHTGHFTVAQWIDNELYVLESQDGWYWPNHNIQKTPYRQWLQWAEEASFNVVHLPLSPEKRALYNETAAIEAFKFVEGMPYGYHNMLLSWIDTCEDNFPPPLSSELLMVGTTLLDHFLPSIADLMWNQAINLRLGTWGLRTYDAYREADRRNMSFCELITLPEQDAWFYDKDSQRPNKGLMCDALVVYMWKAAGLFPADIADDIQVTEFTNWDAYSLNFFDADYKRPQECIDADPDSQFCQILGNYRMSLPGYNTKTPYRHIAEKCPSLAPSFDRPAQC